MFFSRVSLVSKYFVKQGKRTNIRIEWTRLFRYYSLSSFYIRSWSCRKKLHLIWRVCLFKLRWAGPFLTPFLFSTDSTNDSCNLKVTQEVRRPCLPTFATCMKVMIRYNSPKALFQLYGPLLPHPGSSQEGSGKVWPTQKRHSVA